MQYMLLVYDDERLWAGMGEAERGSIMGEYRAFTEELRESGALVSGSQLHPTQAASASPSAGSRRSRAGSRTRRGCSRAARASTAARRACRARNAAT